MKNSFLTLLIFILFSCNQLTDGVENSFSNIGIKLDSVNKIEEKNIETLFNDINSKEIKQIDAENSEIIYNSAIQHNRVVDSLILKLKSIGENELEKKKIIDQFESSKTKLRNKLNTITEFNTKAEIDSLLQPSEDLEILPNFAIISDFQSEKLDATKSAEILLIKLSDKQD